ncbi:hypothetical protein [Fibrobacter sp. UWH1]|uniref:hypothetical protein n=1 Tax=Fibrobacter sp. UWH1 TaxID=1964354 RepID=UPI0015958E32|nr:hypothetical protein [Fibrobacter sp. UWH1]
MNEVKTVVLKKDFYEKHKEHKEILSDKDGRPYLTLVVECKNKRDCLVLIIQRP